jgi:serine/threonine protein kinase/Flp pilus assembly protein TadD
MGEVYLALDTKLDRNVALKILPPDLALHRNRMERFVREAKAAAALNHPNIAHVYEIGETDGFNFIVMEFVDGDTLRTRITHAPLSLHHALEVTIQSASALAVAHEAGIIHRDIKPENVMLRRDGIVKVLDFGLAKLVLAKDVAVDTSASTLLNVNTEPGTVMGTAIYMSPEQARGLELDARTDIFSLGVVLYEMVTGCLPFGGSNTYEIVASILSDKDAPPLARFVKDIPDELERVVAKALRKERNTRYQTMKDFLVDLQSLKDHLVFDAKLKQSAPTVPISSRQLTKNAAPSLLRTIRQYRLTALLALIVILAGSVAAGLYMRGGNSEAAIESIAILPFVNQNKDPNIDYLSDGIPETIMNSLSQLPNLKVMSRNSVFHYKDQQVNAQAVAKELNVQVVLTGTLAKRGDSLSISVELIDAADNRQIWGQRYDRSLADLFVVQQELAKEISAKLRLKLSGAEQKQLMKSSTADVQAFQYYMQGRAYLHRNTREDLNEAIRFYQRAIEEDSNYALAYAGVAEANVTLGARGWISPLEGRRLTEQAARKALELDDNLAEAHMAFGQANTTFSPSDFALGESELRRAIELSPSSASAHTHLGYALVRQGRLDESLPPMMKARELDPLSSIITRNLALPYYLKRDYARALELIRKANQLGPSMSTTVEISFYIQAGLVDEAIAELEKAKRDRPNDPILIYDYGMVYAARGQRAEALQMIKQLEDMSGVTLNQAHFIAKIYAVLNGKEQAFAWLERGLAVGAIGSFYKDEPIWDSMRHDPRFNELLKKMGIPT